MIIIILLIIFLLLFLISPYVDIYRDYRGVLHVVLWYNDFNGNRIFKQLYEGG